MKPTTPWRRLLAAAAVASAAVGVVSAPQAVQAAPAVVVAAAPQPGSLAAARTAAKSLPPSHRGAVTVNEGVRTESFASAAAARFACPCFTYAGGYMNTPGGVTVRGATATFLVARPFSSTSSANHTLAEVSAENHSVGTGRQVVEVGWTVDLAVNGDYDPHLFVYSWVNNVPQGYNASNANWVDFASNPINAGANLNAVASATFPANAKAFGLQYDSSVPCGSASAGWWARYDGSVIGCFKDTQWTGAGVSGFDKTTIQQWFGEVAATSVTPCTDMGNGKQGSAGTLPLDATDPAYIGSASLVGASPATTANLTLFATDATKYSYLGYPSGSPSVTRTFTYGGPGWNGAGTATGTTGAC